jgi:monovalent cation/hydrogen antiporter
LEAITVVLALLASVVASSAITRAAGNALPLPLVQIAFGALVSKAFDFRVSVPPEVFLLLFIAPLLFLDGWRIPREGLFRDKWTITALAFGLVLFTVIGTGLFIHWLIPAMPAPIAFALAAILSPTDAVAVSAIADRAPIPKQLLSILEGESLLNDASGLVCFRFAVAAALTGSFSIIQASGVFLWLVFAGLGVGAAMTVLASAVKDWTARHFGEETGAQILISLLIPFGAYILADQLAASGILAAVAAGIVMGYEERSGRVSAVTRIRRTAVWDAVQYAGNGVIFVILGQQLAGVVAGAGQAMRDTGQQNEWSPLVYIAAISAILFLLRAVWAWVTMRVILFRAAHRAEKIDTPGWRLIAATSLAGVRGAVTLSGVMTLPLVLQAGAAFPTRDLAILVAAGVIVVSLVAANVGLPYVMAGAKLPREPSEHQEERAARVASARAAMVAIEQALKESATAGPDADLYAQAGAHIIAHHERWTGARLEVSPDARLTQRVDEIERDLRLLGLRTERDELYRMARSGKLKDEAARVLVQEVDLQESRFTVLQRRS